MADVEDVNPVVLLRHAEYDAIDVRLGAIQEVPELALFRRSVSHTGMRRHGTRWLGVPEFGSAPGEARRWVRETGTEAASSNSRVTALYR